MPAVQAAAPAAFAGGIADASIQFCDAANRFRRSFIGEALLGWQSRGDLEASGRYGSGQVPLRARSAGELVRLGSMRAKVPFKERGETRG